MANNRKNSQRNNHFNADKTTQTHKLTTIDYPLAVIESTCDPNNYLAPLLNQFRLDRMHGSQEIALAIEILRAYTSLNWNENIFSDRM